jgi:hypothetical protein
MEKRHYELDTRVLAVFFFVAIPFLAVGALIVINVARASLETAVGDSFEQRALELKLNVEGYVADQFLFLRQLSLDPGLRTALAAPARKIEDDKKHEQAWAAGDADLQRTIVGSPLAGRLREVAQVHPGIKMLQLIDQNGRLVASTARGGRFANQDANFFRGISGGSVEQMGYVGDIQRPPNSTTAVLELVYPIRDASDGHLMGALRSMVDAFDLYNHVLAPVRVGSTGRAVLLRSEDGLILASDDNRSVLSDLFPAYPVIQAAQVVRKGHWLLPEVKTKDAAGQTIREPKRVAGYCAVDKIPGVHWTLVIQQDLDEAIAPVRGITWSLLLHFLAVFAVSIVLAFYFSFKLETPVIEDELHLHEEHLPQAWRRTGTEGS